MVIEAVQGERKSATNVPSDLRVGPFSGLITHDAHGRYFEAARLGKLYTTFVKTVTVAATHNTPIAANTATPVVGIINTSSNKAAVLVRVGFGTTSGTPAGGQAVINVIPAAYPTITAAATGSIFNHIPSASASPQGSQMRATNGVALAGWVSTLTTMELLLVGGAAAAAAAGNGGPSVTGEDIGGMIIVPPGALCALMAGTGAGTSWIVNASLTWEEIDWPL